MINIYLPVAHTSINLGLMLCIGIGIGMLSGLFGVGGGFLITPVLMMFGIPPTVAAASGANQMVAASTSATLTHWKLGNVDMKMGLYLLIGSFLGGGLGVQAVKILNALGNIDFVIKVTYILLPFAVGGLMLGESLKKANKGTEVSVKPSMFFRLMGRLPLQIEFEKSGVQHSAILPVLIGILVGILAAIMGVGGGFIMVPIMLYVLRMPMKVIIGTSVFQILFTVIEVTFLQSYTNHTVDFVLALVMLIGSSVGAYVGSMFSEKLNTEQLKVLLALLILSVGFKILFELMTKPSLLLAYTITGGK
ncbi:sulfite exporter TauE/SafE family protein [Candidatus Magnetomonas plexicatena]|uniref:sulfite exporter TauE/SafE family protein n=1 Tax=Candidatus Magnetomonas plexicatena TaxID=2552947 RepID=UPI001C79197A|nr:sulfite exporter TauE/SafE family protein [Nitrospirales bacterium LBB_01]